MTTRPGNLGLDSLRYTRGKFLCHLLLITRKDKETLAVTDHDRAITFEGNTYRPIIFGSLSADRREGALRSGDQDAQGIIDEIYITASDLDAQNYLGAEVRQVIVDWTKPYIVLARHRRWIRKMTRTGQSFTATLEGRAQQLQRPQAGRFGGFFTTKCQYRLGGPFCKKDVSEWLQIRAVETGTTAGQATATSIDSIADSTKSFTVDQFAPTASQHWYITTAIGNSDIGSGQFRKILSNTATTVFVDTPFDTQPNSAIGYRIGRGYPVTTVTRARYEIKVSGMTSTIPGTTTDQFYRDGAVIFTSGDNIGRVVPIADYRASDRRIVLLTPTPFDIALNDTVIVQVGCDGLIGTCRDKFNNILNFGGDPFAPSAQQLIEPPEEA
jgi:uncharacterized phage protein (TIGR02218 family)